MIQRDPRLTACNSCRVIAHRTALADTPSLQRATTRCKRNALRRGPVAPPANEAAGVERRPRGLARSDSQATGSPKSGLRRQHRKAARRNHSLRRRPRRLSRGTTRGLGSRRPHRSQRLPEVSLHCRDLLNRSRPDPGVSQAPPGSPFRLLEVSRIHRVSDGFGRPQVTSSVSFTVSPVATRFPLGRGMAELISISQPSQIVTDSSFRRAYFSSSAWSRGCRSHTLRVDRADSRRSRSWLC